MAKDNGGVRLVMVSSSIIPDWIIGLAQQDDSLEIRNQTVDGNPCKIVEIIGGKAKFQNQENDQLLLIALPGHGFVGNNLHRDVLMITDLAGTVVEWSRWFCPKCFANLGRIDRIDLNHGKDANRIIECHTCHQSWQESIYHYQPRRPPQPLSPPPA